MLALAQPGAAAPAADETLETLFLEPWQNLFENYPLAAALILVPAGVAFLLWGFRLYRWLVVLAYVGVGIVLGVAAADYFNFSQAIGIMVGSIVLGVLAWPLHRMAWGLLGGLVFATVFTAIASWMGLEGRLHLFLVGGVSFVAGVAVTILLMKPLIIVITSLSGAALLAAGVFRLTMMWPEVGQPVLHAIEVRPYLPVAAVIVLAAVGSAMQVFDTNQQKKKKKKPSGDRD
jgi:hypothetical protein